MTAIFTCHKCEEEQLGKLNGWPMAGAIAPPGWTCRLDGTTFKHILLCAKCSPPPEEKKRAKKHGQVMAGGSGTAPEANQDSRDTSLLPRDRRDSEQE
jgi:hypothetical protein